MDVELIDDSDDSGEQSGPGQSLLRNGHGIASEPHVGMEFPSEDAARKFYEDYAKCLGFTIRFGHFNRSKFGKATSVEFVCSRDGMKRRNGERCEAMLRIDLTGEKKWVVNKFIEGHTHPVTSLHKMPVQTVTSTTTNVVETCQAVNKVPSGVMHVSVNESRIPSEMINAGKNPPSVLNSVVNNVGQFGQTPLYPCPRRTLGRDAQNLLDYFKKMQAENPGFYYAVQLDEENRMANAFWADARSRTSYSHFGDAVVLDTMYRINQYRVPFTPFTGVNHHGQTILFGCALLFDESEATFIWLLKTFLAAMDDRTPVSLMTDNDRFLQSAIRQVFPKIRHCINKWDVLREGQERMARVCLAHPNFQGELYNCIVMTESIEEFESCWESILDKYDLRQHDWLRSIYDARQQWVPVYFRDSFFAAVSPSTGVVGSFFDGYVNQQTTLPMFFRQYERALEDSFYKEIEADCDTLCTTPVLRTPSPMEKQAADLYTRVIFSLFQEELVETFVYTANRIEGDGNNNTFRVAKFEDDKKAYIVSLNIAEMKAGCSCQMFEHSGILCRHVLTVFTVTNVLTLPSCYILTRWTRNARSVAISEDRQVHESMTEKYNSLCNEAIRFAEEAAISSETYNLALSSIREARKKVTAIKKSVAKILPLRSQHNGVGSSSGTPEMTPFLWPHQDIREFNLNGDCFPNQPIYSQNVRRMSPASANDGQTGNMMVLTCLKSMTWRMENKDMTPDHRIAVINLKLQDNSSTHVTESEVKFSVSRVTLEPMLKSMAHIGEQLSFPANNVAVINLKLQDADTSSGESEVKFQVSRDTLGALLRSMAYIREQLSSVVEPKQDSRAKKQRI